jgi:benzodiazapine receptor
MGELASPGQLRLSYLRWALVTVPAIVLLGLLSGILSGSGYGNRWFDALAKPGFMPPGSVFPVAWTILYILMGVAFAMILNARGARGRGAATAFFLLQLVGNLAWSPIFFALHQTVNALAVIAAVFMFAGIATIFFARIRKAAALLMLPYLAWLLFAGALNWQIVRLNPDAQNLAPGAGDAQIAL